MRKDKVWDNRKVRILDFLSNVSYSQKPKYSHVTNDSFDS